MMLSAFRIFDESSFNALPRRDRHELNAATMQHTTGMRFGHFLYRTYTVDTLTFGADGAIRLVTDWHRYSGMRRYCLEFPKVPRWECLQYTVVDEQGHVRACITAADVLRWHVSRLRRDGERALYAPFANKSPTRRTRRNWLRATMWQALPMADSRARRAISKLTPHAFRAGLAGDLHRAGVPWDVIAVWCRWVSAQAMRMYASRSPLASLRVVTGFRLLRQGQCKPTNHPGSPPSRP